VNNTTATAVFALIACSCSAGLSTDAPAARTGSQIAASVRSFDLAAREDALFDEITSGNVPSWVGTFHPVVVTRELNGQQYTVTFGVTADYLSVGTDADPFLVPLSPQTAQKVADHFGASLPTRLMVDAIWSAAAVHLEPQPIPPSPQMTTVPVFEQHNNTVQAQKREQQVDANSIVAGHKKDVVLTERLAEASDRVAIYGWHQLNGQPIQPLYIGHTNQWVDYSHGIRLVDREIDIDGVTHDLIDVLSDSVLAPLLSDEGALTFTRYPTE
jgi:hypothetical protein